MEIVREVVFPAPPDEVWEALTEPERLEEWFANDVELDPTPGGDGCFRWDSGEVRRAVVDDVEEGRRLDLRWWDEDEPTAESLFAVPPPPPPEPPAPEAGAVQVALSA